MLSLLNSICRLNRKHGGQATGIPGEIVKNGIAVAEENIWQEVCSAYAYRYPLAQRFCESVVPELPLTFSDGEIHSVFIRHAKRPAEIDLDYFQFKRIMVEIGCIGVVMYDGDDNYIKGLFEYTVPETLITSVDDTLCLHPLFIGSEAKTASLANKGVRKVIYPYGTDPNGIDDREF